MSKKKNEKEEGREGKEKFVINYLIIRVGELDNDWSLKKPPCDIIRVTLSCDQ